MLTYTNSFVNFLYLYGPRYMLAIILQADIHLKAFMTVFPKQ